MNSDGDELICLAFAEVLFTTMARIICKPLPQYDPDSEVKTGKALEALSDDWRVIHSVHWQGRRGKREIDGEADFVLVSARLGVIVLEVKGGNVSIENGRWNSVDRRGFKHEIKNPFEQATASKANLYKWIKSTLGIDAPTMHAVVFPDVYGLPLLGPAAPEAIVLQRSELDNIHLAIDRVASHWGMKSKLSEQDVDRIVGSLAPTVSVKRTFADDAYDSERALLRLTDEQFRAFSGLRRARRAVIYGGPGSGKTLLATEKARQLAIEGHETLLVCYNDLLGRALATEVPDIRATTFHSLCMSSMRKAKLPVPNERTDDWWAFDAAVGLLDAAATGVVSFGAIVVDEGQDFAPDWFDALLGLLSHKDASPFYVFADSDQRIWPRTWEPRQDWFPYELTINCRNTKPIAERVAAVLEEPETSLGASGPTPKWINVEGKSKPEQIVLRTVAQLLDDGFEPEDIAVLCEQPRLATELAQMTVAQHVFCRYGGVGILVETVARFKGLEKLAIVLVLEETSEAPDRIAYVGFSRARTFLQVVAPTSRKKSSNWPRDQHKS